MNYELILNDFKKVPKVIVGLIILSLGIHLVNVAQIGLSPWSVFHDGLRVTLKSTFGNMTIVVGFIILFFSVILLKTKVGLGTLLNIFIVGNLINLYETYSIDLQNSLILKILVFGLGFLLTTFGRSLYIASDLGPGPRDGLFVGLSRITRFEVKHLKPFIEVIVLVTGFILGGNLGIGTLVLTIFSGYFVQFFFKVLRFDPKKKTQSDITLYFNKNQKAEI